MPTAGIQPWGEIHRTGRFRDVNGQVWTIKAADGAVYASVSHNPPVSVPLPAGVTLASPIYFEQFVNTLIMMRGPDLDPLQLTDLTVGFTTVPNPPAGLGLSRIPRGSRAITAGNRLWVMTGTDQVWASNSLDHTAYNVARQFRISDGTPDNMVTMAVFNETDLVCGKERSIWRITDIVGTLAGSQLLPVTHQYGCVAADSMVDIGTDLWWWSQDGPASLTITEFNELQTTAGAQRPMPSADIRPLVARVNAMHRSGICAAVWDRKVYFGVPFGDADSELRHEQLSGSYRFLITTLAIRMTVGAQYRLEMGANDQQLDNLTQTLTVSQDFTALETLTGILGTATAQPVTASLRRFYRGNNAILVCDLDLVDPQTGYGTWQGYDQAAGIEPQQFFLSEYLGKDRLCFDGLDGWSCLYEEGYEDAHPEPYIDVVVSALPAAGNALQVNGLAGELVVAEAQQTNNVSAAARWGIGVVPLLATAIDNLWVSLAGPNEMGGFTDADNTTGGWSAPNTEAVKLSNGVRFNSTNGVLPSVSITGSWATVTYGQWLAIETDFLSRGLRRPEPVGLYRGLALGAQLMTWHPRYTLSIRPEGVLEEKAMVTDRTRSRTRYDRPFDRADWVETNVNDDFDTRGRQDYSLNLSGAGFKLGDGLGVGLHQEATHWTRADRQARAMQVRITNDLGRCRIIAISYEARESDRGMGIKI